MTRNSSTSSITPEMVARYQPGALVTEAQFTSAVPHEWGAFEGNFRFVIDSFHGRTASAAAELAFEDELLFAPNTVFKVWAVQQPAQGRPEYTVYMQELPGGDASIPPHPEFIALLPK